MKRPMRGTVLAHVGQKRERAVRPGYGSRRAGVYRRARGKAMPAHGVFMWQVAPSSNRALPRSCC
jgi:hypothetical protein